MNRKFSISITMALVMALLVTAVVLADQIANNIDATVDSTFEIMSLNPGGSAGYTTLYLVETNGDGKEGCNLTGKTTLVVSVNSSDTSVATVSPTSVTFTSCGFTQELTITPHEAGSANITLSQTSNSTSGTFELGTASFTVNVASSNAAPVVTVIGVNAGGSYEYGSVPAAGCSATDAEDGGPFTFGATLSSITGQFAGYGLGSQTATCSYTDSGNRTTSVSATYSINDTTAPLLAVPVSFSVEATSSSGAVVNYSATATDTVDSSPVVDCAPASGSAFAIATTTVSCTATDFAGNGGTPLTFDVTVEDTTRPTIGDNADLVLEATGPSGAVATFSNPTASDTVDTSVDVVCAPASGSTFGLGTVSVTCTATDNYGNHNSSSFEVTVQDTTLPTIADNADMVLEATGPDGATATFNNPEASDIVDSSVGVACAPASGGIFALGHHKVICTVTDDSGNSAHSDFDVFVQDTTPPTIADNVDMLLEATGPDGAAATFNNPGASDIVDSSVGVVCSPASGGTFALGHHNVICTATDDSGNNAQSDFDVLVQDTTPPVIAAHDSETAEATSAAGAIVNYMVPSTSDAVDGPRSATCVPASGSTFVLGETTVTCNAVDAAGNNAIATTFVVHIVDTTPPTITYINRTIANGNGWNNTNVTINWSCSDIVEVINASISATVSTEGSAQSATGTCEDTSGNKASDTQTGVNIDMTAPSASASRTPTANSFGWNNSDVTVSFSGSDGLSGIDSCSDAQIFGEGASQSASGTCTDKAGNVSDAATVADINIDKTAPALTWNGGPADSASYYFGSVPAAPTCTASDALSGANGCGVTGYSALVGSYTLTATAYDKAGNSKVETRTYNVQAWTLKGFYQPVDMNGVFNLVKNGSTVPLKFEIFAGPTELSDVSSVKSLTYALAGCSATTTTDEIETLATGGTVLRYDITGGQFIFNWKTPSTAGKCYRVTMTTQDGTTLMAYFKLK